MSDLDDIIAAAGIVIVDTAQGDGGDADNKAVIDGATDGVKSRQEVVNVTSGSGDTRVLPEVEALETMFSYRYSMDDPDYVRTVNEAEANSQPPCVQDFRDQKTRDYHQRKSWRGRGGGGGGYGRGGYRHDNRSYRDREDNRNWHHRDGGDGRRYYQDRSRERDRYY